jgi:AraC-like DNA-binding protein
MAGVSSDRCKIPKAFWYALEQLTVRPAAVLRQAGLPATLHVREQGAVSTAQLFAIWEAVEKLTAEPGFGIRLVEATNVAAHKPAFFAAFYASNYRDALSRVARFRRMCTPEKIHFAERDGQFIISTDWPCTDEPQPSISVDVNFGFMLELGRRGTGQRLTPIRVDLRRSAPQADVHWAYFGCPVHYGAARDELVLRSSDLDRPFPGHNPELLDLLTPALTAALSAVEAQCSIGGQVKVILKRGMASGRPGLAAVARDLGMSARTLQRRITDEGTTFRVLLAESRQELGRYLLSDGSLGIEEVACLLGYQDTSSFYRAFNIWEGMSPSNWRQADGSGRPGDQASRKPGRPRLL